jgi:glycosyltransferase involved in cell wall biosynthesis
MKISVIMPSYNQAAYVEQAILSVLGQDWKDKELIFVDGASTDGTVEIARRYEAQCAHFISEPDAGQSAAMIKGFDLATGDVLTWLNTDDVLLPDTLRNVASAFRTENSPALWFGNVVWMAANGTVLKCSRGEKFRASNVRHGLLSACGPSAFFSQNLYRATGGINPDLHYMMDTELWWKMIGYEGRFGRLPSYCWALRLHEDSKVSGHLFRAEEDPKQVEIRRRQHAERAYIQKLIAKTAPGFDTQSARLFRSAARAVSVPRWRGKVDSWRHRGRSLEEMTVES